ncbi:hypothetical protein [Nocardioides speluncae]|nr:hypothetical protein [Nocardioides speluncae]
MDENEVRHRQSNGVRVNGIYFLVVSLVALVVVLVAIAIASSM